MYRIDKLAKCHHGFTEGVQVAALQGLLGDDEIELVCRQLGHAWRDRIFTPTVTVRSMIYRALNPDKSIQMPKEGPLNGSQSISSESNPPQKNLNVRKMMVNMMSVMTLTFV